jgi:hypothetical protein
MDQEWKKKELKFDFLEGFLQCKLLINKIKNKNNGRAKW